MQLRTSTNRRTIATAAAVSAAAVVGVAVGVAVSTGDPSRQAEASRLDAVVIAPEPAVPAASAEASGSSAASASGGSADDSPTQAPPPTSVRTITVDGLQQVSGVLVRGDDLDDWYLAGIELDLGPERWLRAAGPTEDFDGDGTTEALLVELEGLLGRETTFGVRYDDDGDDDRDDDRDDGDRDDGDRDAYVFTIAGKVYWDPASSAPWAVGAGGSSSTTQPAPGAAGAEGGGAATRDQAVAAAVAAVGEGAVAVDVWEEREDVERWEIDVLTTDGREYDVRLDAAGRVIDVRLD